MKVLVISHMYPSTFNEVDGIFVHEQAKALVKEGIEVKVVSPIPWTPFPINHLSPKWKAYSMIPLRSAWDGIEVHYPRYRTYPKEMLFASSGWRMYQGIKRPVDKIHQKFPFDLIHAHAALPAGYAAVLIARRYRRPLVITVHGYDLQVTFYKSAKCRSVLLRTLEQANRVITVSTKLGNLAKANIEFSEKVVVINNGINVEGCVSVEGNLSPNYTDHRILLSVSSLIATKGIDLNLRAISRLVDKYPNLKYVVIGGGPQTAVLRKLTSKLNLDKHVEFLGQLPHEEVLSYMAIADVFSLPSWKEGFGIVYLEAMASGKPVIGCRGEGIEDVIENGRTGVLVKPKDVDSLAEVLDFLLSHPKEAQAIGEQARRLVTENYTWEENAEKIIQVYEDVLCEA